MCGIVAVVAPERAPALPLEDAAAALFHRGPDAGGVWTDATGRCRFAHRRLKILDLSDAGNQPMSDPSGRFTLVFNGEIYNYVELRAELGGEYRSACDTEVLLAAFLRWGEACLDRLVGMFAFVVWDAEEGRLFAARDRFGKKPLYLHRLPGGGLILASEIKALHVLGVERRSDPATWATYLTSGLYDHDRPTFYEGVETLPVGGALSWSAESGAKMWRWYDAGARVAALGPDERSEDEVMDELLHLFEESVRWRFRSDVGVGIALSGGLDSSLLLGLVVRLFGRDSGVKTFTYTTPHPDYDESPWVREMVRVSRNPAFFCPLEPAAVPALAARVQRHQDEPWGGFPTLGMAGVHATARDEGVIVLLDGNGLDEGWCGYEYYARARETALARGPVQSARSPTTRPDCLAAGFAALARPFAFSPPFDDPVRNLQARDLQYAKIPRAVRFNDRVSMQYSREQRSPFLDHRILELGLRQPLARKISDGQGKWLVRRLAERAGLLPADVRQAPKRPVQTPQREWMRRELAGWVREHVERMLAGETGAWFDAGAVRAAVEDYMERGADNSFPLWQWVSLSLASEG